MGNLYVRGTAAANGGLAAVNPDLAATVQAAVIGCPYDVEVYSGRRPDGDSASRHYSGDAIDLVLIDPATAKEVANYVAGGEAFLIYEEFARRMHDAYDAIAHKQSRNFRWGGYFGGSRLNPGGADLMHFDVNSPLSMGLGTFENGLTAEGRAHLATLGPGQIYSSRGIRQATEAPVNLWTAAGGGQTAAGVVLYDPAIDYPEIRQLQQLLRAKGYVTVGTVDGKAGSLTVTAINRARADNGYPMQTGARLALSADDWAMLARMPDAPIAEARAQTTVTDLARNGSPVATNAISGAIAIGTSAVGTVAELATQGNQVAQTASNAVDQLTAAASAGTKILDFLHGVGPIVAVLGIAVGGFFLVRTLIAHRNDHRTGRHV